MQFKRELGQNEGGWETDAIESSIDNVRVSALVEGRSKFVTFPQAGARFVNETFGRLPIGSWASLTSFFAPVRTRAIVPSRGSFF